MKINFKQENQELWNERVQAWQRSNKSMSAWCREKDLNYRQFIWWKIRLLGKRRKLAPSNFIELAPTPSQNCLTLEVGGFRIQVSSC